MGDKEVAHSDELKQIEQTPELEQTFPPVQWASLRHSTHLPDEHFDFGSKREHWEFDVHATQV